MTDPDDHVLSYARKPSALAALASWLANHRRVWIRVGVYGLFLVVGFGCVHGRTSGQIRLDTGDLRYCWFGIPLEYRRMPEPQRSKLLELAAKSPSVPSTWVTCVTYPLPSSNNTDVMCCQFYNSIATWADEGPKIARWALDDVVDYIPHMLSTGGLSDTAYILLSSDLHSTSALRLDPSWRDNYVVKAYCAAHGYTPLPAPASAAASSGR